MNPKSLLMLITVLPVVLGFMIFVSAMAAGGSGVANPIQPPCTQEKAEEYALVCDELGVPWDVVLVADAYLAVEDGRNGIEDLNPLNTALQFSILREDVYYWEIVGYIEVTDEETGETTSEPVYDWVYNHTNEFIGRAEILGYVEITGSLDDLSSSYIIAEANEVAESKSNDTTRYEVSFAVNPDLKFVLTDFIGISEENAEKVLELHESRYIVCLYSGESFYIAGDYDLPEITAGNVSRLDLARVAASIINHPYAIGNGMGKSPYVGSPVGPLDCSGYVDWVYVQCFGRGVNGSGVDISTGTAIQFYSSATILEEELKIGDLGFYQHPKDVPTGSWNHVGIYIGIIDGQRAFINCGGTSFGYSPGRESGRVGISKNGGGSNNVNPLGGTFSPPMISSNFRYFKRPQFQFSDDVADESGED